MKRTITKVFLSPNLHPETIAREGTQTLVALADDGSLWRATGNPRLPESFAWVEFPALPDGPGEGAS